MAGLIVTLRHELRLLGVAWTFLTRLPLPRRWTPGGIDGAAWDPQWLHDAVRHFPLVGAAVGALGASALALLAPWSSPWVAATAAVAATAWVTGAFHEDGLADSADALGGAVGRERALAIMKDSRIGSYGALALILVTLLRVGLLAQLLGTAGVLTAAAALVWSHALARWAAVGVMAGFPYAGDAEHAKAKPLALGVPAWQALAALAWGVALGAALASAAAIAWPCGGCEAPPPFGAGSALAASLAAAAALVAAMRRWLRRRLGGYTGDTLGATEQLSETLTLAVLAAAWAAPGLP